MAFFIFLISVWIVLWLISKFTSAGLLQSHAYKARIAFSAGFIFIGILHIIKPESLTYMIEDFVPYPVFIVYATGFMEIGLAIMIQIKKLRKITGWIIIAYLIAIFPANIYVAVNNLPSPGSLPSEPWYQWLRLFFQPVYIAWVYFCAINPEAKQAITAKSA